MSDSKIADLTDSLLEEFTSSILEGGPNILNTVSLLGMPYDETKVPLRWIGKVICHGVGAELSHDLIRRLILRSLAKRNVPHDPKKLTELIDAVYAEQKGKYDQYPDYYKELHSKIEQRDVY